MPPLSEFFLRFQGFLGASLEPLWGFLGASWRPLSSLERRGGLPGLLRRLLGSLERNLDVFWRAVWQTLGVRQMFQKPLLV